GTRPLRVGSPGAIHGPSPDESRPCRPSTSPAAELEVMARRPGHASCRGREWWTVCRPERGVVCHRVLAAAEYHQELDEVACRLESAWSPSAPAESSSPSARALSPLEQVGSPSEQAESSSPSESVWTLCPSE